MSPAARSEGFFPASPRARRLMRERGIAAEELPGPGSGPDGRLTARDVPAQARSRDRHRQMRQAIAEQTTRSISTIPHIHLEAEADVTGLMDLRARLASDSPSRARVTLTDWILRAQAFALKEVPEANRIWRDAGLDAVSNGAVGLVVALPQGLLIPVLAEAAGGTLEDLARRRAAAVAEARAGRLPPEFQGPAATSLSNLGTARVDSFSAIISPPQSTILAAGRVAWRPWAHEGVLSARQTIRLRLSADHRVLDGLPAAKLLERIVHWLEDPRGLEFPHDGSSAHSGRGLACPGV